jgi:hypothetical protein
MGRSHIRFLASHGVRERQPTDQPPHKPGSTAASAVLLFLWAWQWGYSLRYVFRLRRTERLMSIALDTAFIKPPRNGYNEQYGGSTDVWKN